MTVKEKFSERTCMGPASKLMVAAAATFAMMTVSVGQPVLAAQVDPANAPVGLAIAVDAAGNTHITGSFEGTVDFDNGPGVTNLTSNGESDMFFAAYDLNGNLVRAHSIGGSGRDQGNGIAVDAAGNTHITGSFEETVDFEPGPGTTSLTSSGRTDAFVAVFDPTGNLSHAHSFGDDDPDGGNDVATDASGNTHILGFFKGTVDFDPGAGENSLLNSSPFFESFVAVYNPNGNLVHAFTIAGSDRVSGIDADAAGNTYITGTLAGTVDFDPGPGVTDLTSNGDSDLFTAVYDPMGALVHAQNVGGTGAAGAGAAGSDIVVDAAGNMHIAGFFLGTVDFDPGPGVTSLTSASNGSGETFVAVYDPDGNLKHAQRGGAPFIPLGQGTSPLYIAADPAGNTYITGPFEGSVDFDSGPGESSLTSNGGIDIFVAAYDPTGNLVAVHGIGGTGPDLGTAIAADATGNVYITGALAAPEAGKNLFTATVSFDLAPPPARFCSGQLVTIDLNITPGASATTGDDVIVGTPGNDVIDGLAGNDTICGQDGDDTITGGSGNDTVLAGSGDDTVLGDEGDDTIMGEAGRDILRGGPGIDEVHGGDGNDRVLGGIGDDNMTGGDGNDYLGGFGGADTINGGSGNEVIFGGFGPDTINGGAGDDAIFGLIGDDTINGGTGNDKLNGDRGNDTIDGNVGNDELNGGNANDILTGGAGNDSLNGGKADDTLDGGTETDICAGNLGTDTATNCETTFGIP